MRVRGTRARPTCTPRVYAVYAVYARATELSAAALSTAAISAAPLSAATGAQHASTRNQSTGSRDLQARKDLHSCSTAAPGEGRRGDRKFACQSEFPEFVSGAHVLELQRNERNLRARKGPGCMYIHEYYADDTPKKSEREGSN